MFSVNNALTLEGMTAGAEVGEGSVSFFGNAASTPTQLVSSVFADQQQLAIATDLFRQTVERAALDRRLLRAGFPECIESSPGSLRFNDCEVVTETTTTTMNGVLEVVAGRILAEIVVDASFASDEGTSLTTRTEVSADMSVSESHIEGRIDVHTRVDIPGVGFATQTAAAIYDVDLAAGCAVGGDLRVGVLQTAKAQGRSQSVRAIGRAVFGPACGDVTVNARAD
jgi:hypothetical protein